MGTHPIFESDFDCLTDLMESERVIVCKRGFLCEEVIYLNCILYKIKNATKSHRFYRSLQYLMRLCIKAGLAQRSNTVVEQTIARITNAESERIAKACDFAARAICGELREGDGYMPVLLAAATAVSVIKNALSNQHSLSPKIDKCQENKCPTDEGEVVKSSTGPAVEDFSLFSELMGSKEKRPVAPSSDSEEEQVV